MTAEWCSPCRSIKQWINDFCNEKDMELIILDIDKDSDHYAWTNPMVLSVPSIKIFDNDELVLIHSGGITKDKFESKYNGLS